MDDFVIDFELLEEENNYIQPFLETIFNSRRKKPASEEAIASLEKVDVSKLTDKFCTICYDEFSIPSNEHDGSKSSHSSQAGDGFEAVLENDKRLKTTLAEYDIHKEPLIETSKFNDPSMFFPTDPGGVLYSRFPQRNLATFDEVTMEDQFPGYKKWRSPTPKSEKYQKEGHIAVKMPECEHVFGLPCIVEWLKSNVSCPLCRKEVEAKNENSRKSKREAMEQRTSSNFNDREVMLDHMENHSTDVFNPFRRPYNPRITPITDSYMHQEWSTPYSQSRVGAMDPDVVMPRKFPCGDPIVSRRRNTFRPSSRTVNRVTTNGPFGGDRRSVRVDNNVIVYNEDELEDEYNSNPTTASTNNDDNNDNDNTDATGSNGNDSETRTARFVESEDERSDERRRRRRSASNESSRSARRVIFSPHTTNIDDLHD